MLNKLPHYTLSLIVFAVILTLCWLPASTVQEPQWFHIPNADKIIHFGLFFVWAFCLRHDLLKQIHRTPQLILAILLLGLFTALLTEGLQPIVSNRMRDWIDGIADMTGIVTAVCCFSFFVKKNLS
ncbi:MAG: VanZ family protein [Cytophagaceae bacterium]|nr:VanZ family protein [Cytophagaceae bacterium]